MHNNLYILTTAIIRPRIHKRGIENFIKLVSNSENLKKNFQHIYFIINLDDVLKKYRKHNIKLLKKHQKDNIYVKIFENNINPCFFNAFRNVYLKCSEIHNNLENNIFFWLEDDWYIAKDNFNKHLEKEIITFINDENQYLMTVNWKPSGPPFLFKKFYFNKMIDYFNSLELNDDRSKDPENVMRRIWKTNNIVGFNKRKQIGVRLYKNDIDYNYPILFTDAGENWASENNLKKWHKSKNNKEENKNKFTYKNKN